jgi:1-phosphofructokinase
MPKYNHISVDTVTITLNPAIDQTVTISNFTTGAVNRVERDRSNPGGKGVNVASALADYGQRVAVTGFLGRENSASFEMLFEEKQIEDRFVMIAGQTRVGIKIVDPARHETTDINFPGAPPSAEDLVALSDTLDSFSARRFVLAGSVPPGVKPGIYRQLIMALKGKGGQIVLDASDEPLRLALDSKPDLIKPNIHELETLVGKRLPDSASVIQAARELIGKGVGMVAASMGRDGACFVSANEAVIAVPPDVPIRSTFGAGDAMVAGIIAGQSRGLSLAGTARLATAFSVHALTRQGQEPDVAAAIDSFLPQVRLQSEN